MFRLTSYFHQVTNLFEQNMFRFAWCLCVLPASPGWVLVLTFYT